MKKNFADFPLVNPQGAPNLFSSKEWINHSEISQLSSPLFLFKNPKYLWEFKYSPHLFDIIKNNDNTLSLYRADINDELKSDKDGRRFDGDCFSKKWNEKIDIKNFDPSIKKGDMCLFMYTPDGWIINRAKEIKGNLVDGEDHKYYKIGENKFQDAMRFSRDNIIIFKCS